MTALQLLGYITAAWLLQLTAGAGIFVWRKRRAPGAAPIEAEAEHPWARGAWPGWRDFRVVRRAFEDAGRSQCSFHLAPLDGQPLPPFRPGQYLTFGVQLSETEVAASGSARDLTRCYSLSDRPDPTSYRVTIKRAGPPPDQPGAPPGASSTHFHDHVFEGHVLRVKAPAGRFFIDPDASVPAVFVAGGIGITPMLSMLRWCVAEQPGRPLHLFYGVRSGADHAFRADLQELARAHPALHVHTAYSSPGPADVLGQDYQHAGRVDVDLLRRTLPHGRHQFYVCGPPAMMKSLVPALRAWGVRDDDLHAEAFGPASVGPSERAGSASSEPPDATALSIDVQFRRSGRTLQWDGRDANLLDFAERHGVVVDSGCRSGSCGSCETALVSGTVAYAEAPDHDIAPGRCLLCVGKPMSALTLEA